MDQGTDANSRLTELLNLKAEIEDLLRRVDIMGCDHVGIGLNDAIEHLNFEIQRLQSPL